MQAGADVREVRKQGRCPQTPGFAPFFFYKTRFFTILGTVDPQTVGLDPNLHATTINFSPIPQPMYCGKGEGVLIAYSGGGGSDGFSGVIRAYLISLARNTWDVPNAHPGGASPSAVSSRRVLDGGGVAWKATGHRTVAVSADPGSGKGEGQKAWPLIPHSIRFSI